MNRTKEKGSVSGGGLYPINNQTVDNGGVLSLEVLLLPSYRNKQSDDKRLSKLYILYWFFVHKGLI